MTTVTLIDGREVDSASEGWREECLIRARHVWTMRSMDVYNRRRYVQDVAQREGAEAGLRLQREYTADWQRRKAELAAAEAAAAQDPRANP